MRVLPAVFGGLGITVLLTGCATNTPAGPGAEPGFALTGSVHGGQQPIVGAHVYLLAANTTGYGNASVSLLTNVPGSTLIDTSGGPTNGDYFVMTGVGGGFDITGDYSCTPGTQVYLYALGGNPGLAAGTNNAASGLLAALGNCPSTENFVNATPFIAMNEVSTVAAAYALAGFATDATHVSSSGTPLALTGVANAFANATNIASLASGAALTKTPGGNGFVPQGLINSLANILASCVNSSGMLAGPSSPSACYSLFQVATIDGTTTGASPMDTATAAINIAHHPGSNTAALYSLITPAAPFAPALSSQPHDLTLSLMFQGGGYGGSTSIQIAIDSQGNAWFTNYTSYSGVYSDVGKLSPLGIALSPATGFTGSGINAPFGMAIDNEDNVWVLVNNGVIKLNNGGVPFVSSPFTGGGINASTSVAIDGFDNVWLTNVTSLSKLSASGTPISPAAGYPVNGVLGLHSAAIDAAEEVVVIDNTGKVMKLTNAAVPSPGFPLTIKLLVPTLTTVAVDGKGNLLVDDSNPGSLYKFSNTGLSASGYPITINSGGGGDVVIDGSGNIWIQASNRINEVSALGILANPDGFPTNGPTYGIGVDGSGNVWTSLPSLGFIEEIVGCATPVVTPLAAAVKTNLIGSRP